MTCKLNLSNLKSLEDKIHTSQFRTLASLLSFSERLGWHTPYLIIGLKVGHSGAHGVTVHPISLVADLIAGTHPPTGGVSFLGGFQMKSPEEEEVGEIVVVWQEGSSSSRLFIRVPPKKETLGAGGFFLSFFLWCALGFVCLFVCLNKTQILRRAWFLVFGLLCRHTASNSITSSRAWEGSLLSWALRKRWKLSHEKGVFLRPLFLRAVSKLPNPTVEWLHLGHTHCLAGVFRHCLSPEVGLSLFMHVSRYLWRFQI